MKHTVVFLFLLLSFHSFAQNADSLLAEYYKAPEEKKFALLIKIAEAQLNTSPDKSLYFSEQALRLSVIHKNKNEEGDARLMSGRAILAANNFNEATEQFLSAKKLYKETKNIAGESECLFYIGDIHFLHEDYNLSLQKYTEALTAAASDYEIHDYSKILYRLGNTCLKLGSFQKAENYFSDGNEAANKFGNAEQSILCLDGSGQVFSSRKSYDSALIFFVSALRSSRQNNYIAGLVLTLNHIGETYRKKGDEKLANQYLKEALKYSENLKDKYVKSLLRANIDDIYNAAKDLKTSEQNIQHQEKTTGEIDYTLMKLDNYRKAADSARRAGNEVLAKQFEVMARILEDSVHRIENRERIRRVQAIYNRDKRLKELEEIENRAAEKNLFVIIFSSLSFVLSLLALVFARLYIKQKNKSENYLSAYRNATHHHHLRTHVLKILHQKTNDLTIKLNTETGEKRELSTLKLAALAGVSADWLLADANELQPENLNIFNLYKTTEYIKHQLEPLAKNSFFTIHNQVKADAITTSDEARISAAIRCFVLSVIFITEARNKNIFINSRQYEPRIEMSISSDVNIMYLSDTIEKIKKILSGKIIYNQLNDISMLLVVTGCEILKAAGITCEVESNENGNKTILFVLESGNFFEEE